MHAVETPYGPLPVLGRRFVRSGTWSIAGWFAIDTVMNLAARHPFERWVLGGTTLVAAGLIVVVALSDRPA